MEGPTETPPTAGTSSKLVSFPESTWDNEDKKLPKLPASTPRHSFPLNLLTFFGTFSSKSSARKKPARVQRDPGRKILRTSTVSSLSLYRMESSIQAVPYKWPHDSSFDSNTTALLIIDMQKDCKYSSNQFIFAPLSFYISSSSFQVFTCDQEVI